MDPNSNLNLTTLTLTLTKAWGDHTLQVGWDNQTVMTPAENRIKAETGEHFVKRCCTALERSK